MNELKELGEIKKTGIKVFDGEVLHLRKDTITLPNGKEATREVIRHIGAVCVVPVLDDGRVIVERQFRYPVNGVITEIPAGKLNTPDEDRLEAIKRELREETGYTADEWTDLGLYYPSPAYCDEKITIFLARGLHAGDQDLDEDEFLEVKAEPFENLVSDVLNGVITDGKTQVGILKAAKYLGRL